MKKLLDQFKNLNTRDPGAWPPAPKALLLAGLLIGIVAMGYFLDWQEEMESLEAGRLQEIKLKDEYVGKQQQAINLDLYRQQLRDRQFLRRLAEATSQPLANGCSARRHQPG